LVKINK